MDEALMTTQTPNTDNPQYWLDEIAAGRGQSRHHEGSHASPGTEEQVTRHLAELNARHLLIRLREEAGLTQQEVADILNKSRPAVHQSEHRPLESMTLGTFARFVAACGYKLDLESAIKKPALKPS